MLVIALCVCAGIAVYGIMLVRGHLRIVRQKLDDLQSESSGRVETGTQDPRQITPSKDHMECRCR